MKSIFLLLLATLSYCFFASFKKPSFEGYSPKKKEFLVNNYQEAVQVEELYGIPIAITLAVAIEESGWGTSRVSKELNNYFGISGRGRSKMCFDSKAASFDYFGNLLSSTKRYKPLMLIRKDDIEEWVCMMSHLGYNRRKTWRDNVYSIIKINKLDEL